MTKSQPAEQTPARKGTQSEVYVIYFLNSLMLGLTIPVVPPTVLSNGGTHLTLGLSMSLGTIVRLMSSNILGELLKVVNRKQLLLVSLILTFLLNFGLYFTHTYWQIIINRLLFGLLSQVLPICQGFVIPETQTKMHKNLHLLQLVASIVGSILVGHFLNLENGFYIIAAIATLISIPMIAIAYKIDKADTEKTCKPSQVLRAMQKTYSQSDVIHRLMDVRYTEWRILLVKMLLILSSIVLYIKFVVFIIVGFDGSSLAIGYTGAYQMLVIFLANFVFLKTKDRLTTQFTKQSVMELSLLVLTISSFCLGFASSHNVYLIFVVPVYISRAFVENYFVDLFRIRQNQNLLRDLQIAGYFAEIVGPMLIGMSFNLLRHNAFRFFILIPVICILSIVRNNPQVELKTASNKENSSVSDENKSK